MEAGGPVLTNTSEERKKEIQTRVREKYGRGLREGIEGKKNDREKGGRVGEKDNNQKRRKTIEVSLLRLHNYGGRDSSVGIAIRYWLDGAGIEYRWGRRDFPHPPRPALGPTQPPVQWVLGLSRG